MWRWIPLLLMALVLPVLGLLLLALFLWWLLSRRDREAEEGAFEIEIEPIPAEPEAAEAEVESRLAPEQPEGGLEPPEIDGESSKPTVEVADLEAAEPPAARVAPEPSEEPPEPRTPDDLKEIEGIGPKIAQVLGEAGITTFAQLAATEVERLRQILEAADPRLVHLADPGSWPEQSRLAAAGKMEALDALKKALKGGKRVE